MPNKNESSNTEEAVEPHLIVDFKTRQVLTVSDSLAELFSSSTDKLVNVKLDSILAVSSKGDNFDTFFKTVEKHALAKLDRVALNSDKSAPLFLEIYASMLTGENQEKLVKIWVQDVTARETTIAAYQKNEMLRNRVEQLGAFGHWERDMQTGQGVWSDELYRILGIDPKEHDTSLKTFFKLVEPEDLPKVKKAIDNAMSGAIDSTMDAQYRITCPDGIKKHIHGFARMFEDEHTGNRVFVGILHDITERKQAEEELKISEKHLSQAQQIAHLGSWELEIVSNKLSWSDEVYRIFEIDPEEFGASYEAFVETIHPDDREMVNKAYTDSIRDRNPYDIEHRLLMKDGRIKYVHERCETSYDERGKPLKSLGTVLDITERVQHEKEMKERKERLRLVKDMAMEITSEMSIEEVVTNALEGIFNMFPNYRVSYGVRIDENLYRCMASVGSSRLKNIKGTNFNITNAPEFVEALAKGYVVTNDILQDEMVMPLRGQLKELQIRAMINTPVVHAAWLVGVLWLDSDVPRTWSDHEITTLEDVSRYLAVAVKNAQLIEERKKASEELKAESAELIEKNIALNQVLEHLEKDKQNYKEQISESIESLLLPIVKKLKKRDGNLSPKDISLLENSLDAIVGKEINVFRKNLVKLSPRELDICELIRAGKSSKEISSFLNLSTLTVHKHRESIRSKLQLKNKSTNLSAYLRTREFLTDSTQSLRN